jgi:hypothetical protein
VRASLVERKLSEKYEGQTFGTHAALFGVNPWRLQAWLGRHVAEQHHRVILRMLAARGKTVGRRPS